MHDLSVQLCLCFFIAVRDFALQRVACAKKRPVPTRSSWSFRSFEKKAASHLAQAIDGYCIRFPGGIWYRDDLVSWSIWELLRIALGKHRKRNLEWTNFHLSYAERLAVWRTAVSCFAQGAAELDYGEEALRGVTVYEGDNRPPPRKW